MLFWLRSQDGTYAKYLVDNNTFRVGRKEGEIVLTNDQSISRQHAVLTITVDGVTLEDCKSKYGTYVNSVKLQPCVRVSLQVGDEIKFGCMQSIFTLESQEMVVVASNIKKADKKAILDNVAALKGSVLDTLKPDCTLLVVKEIMLTPKVLICVIRGTSIVTPKYFIDFLENVKANRQPPDIKDYKPPCGEAVLSQKSVNLDYIPERKKLFANKTFVFSNKTIWNQMTDLIQAAGGKAILFDGLNITVDTIKQSREEYLILNDSDNFEKNKELQAVLEYLKKRKQRAIPLQEIAVAIVKNSCIKDCNPNFNRAANLVEKTNNNFTCGAALVFDTQTQTSEMEVKDEIIVPSSYENTISLQCPITFEAGPSSKREGEALNRTDVNAKVTKTSKVADVHQKSPIKKLTQTSISNFLPISGSQTTISNTSVNQYSNPYKRKTGNVEEAKQSTNISDSFAETSAKTEKNFFKRPKIEKKDDEKGRVSTVKHLQTKEDEMQNVLSSTLLSQNDNAPSFFSLDMSTIKHEKVDDTGKEWITVGNKKENERSDLSKIKNENVDPEIQEFINSFRNRCIVKIKNCVAPERSRVSVNDTTASSSASSSIRNFKKFRKNPMVRHQTTIIPKNFFEKVPVMI